MADKKNPTIKGKNNRSSIPKFKPSMNIDDVSTSISQNDTKLMELYLKASKESNEVLKERIKLLEHEEKKSKSILENLSKLKTSNKDVENIRKAIYEKSLAQSKISLEINKAGLDVNNEITKTKQEQLNFVEKLYNKISSGLRDSLKIEDKISNAKERQNSIYDTINDLVVKKEIKDKETLSFLSEVLELNEELTNIGADNIQSLEKRGILEYKSIDLSEQKYKLENMIADLSEKTNTEEIQSQQKILNMLKEEIKIQEKQDKLLSEARNVGEFGANKIKNQGSEVKEMLNKGPSGKFINPIKKFIDGTVGNFYNKKSKSVGNQMGIDFLKEGGGSKGLANSFKILNSAISFTTKAMSGLTSVVGLITMLFGILLKLFLRSDELENKIQAAMDLTTNESRYGTKTAFEKKQNTLMKTYDGLTIDNVIESTENLRNAMDGFRLDVKNGNEETQSMFDLNVGLQSRIGLTGDEVNALHGATKLLNVPMNKLVLSTIVIGDKIIGAKNALQEMAKLSKSVLISFKGTTNELIMAVTKAKMLGTSLDKMRAAGDRTLDIESSLEKEMENRVITGENVPMDLIRYYSMTEDIVNLQDTIMTSLGSLDNWKSLNKFGRKSKAEMMGFEEDEITNMLTRQQQLTDYGMSTSKYNEYMQMSDKELTKIIETNKSNTDLGNILSGIIADRDTRTAEKRLEDAINNLTTFLQKELSPVLNVIKESLDILSKSLYTLVSLLGGNWFGGNEEKNKSSSIPDPISSYEKNFNKPYGLSEFIANPTAAGLGVSLGQNILTNYFKNLIEPKSSDENALSNYRLNNLNYGPKYAKGIVNLDGPGSGLSDSISARLSAGESVMTASATRKNSEFFEFANAGGNIKDMIVNTITAYKKSAIVNALSNSGYSNSNNSNVSSNSSIPKTSQNVDTSMDKVVNLLQQILSVASQPAMVKLGDTFVQEIDSRIQLRAGMRANIDGTWGRTV